MAKRLEYLVDQKLDGTLTGKGRKELDQLLAASEDHRKYLQHMEQLEEGLKQTAQRRVQPDFSPKVMERLQAKKSPGTGRSNIITGHFMAASRPLLRYAAILLIGLVVGSALTLVLLPGRIIPDPMDVAATMSARSGQKLSFNQDGWQMHIHPMVVDQMVIVVVSASSEHPMDIRLAFDTQAYRFIRARYLSGRDAGSVMQAGAVHFGVEGEAVYQLVLQQIPGMTAPFLLEVVQDGRIVYQSDIIVQ